MKVFLFGGTGLLGTNWIYHRRDIDTFIVNVRSKRINLPNVKNIELDLLNEDEVLNAVPDDVDLIVNAIGFSDVDGCEKDPQRARIENGEIPGVLASVALKKNIKFVHISTDHLFDGTKSLVDENESPDPVNEYGRSKLQGEQAVIDRNPGALVVRTNFYGIGNRFRKSFSDWIYENLSRDKEITMYSKIYYTPLYVSDLVDNIYSLVKDKQNGIHHVVSADRVSKLEFGKSLAEIFKFDSGKIIEGDYDSSIVRPSDMSLVNKKSKEGLSVKSGLLHLKDDVARDVKLRIDEILVPNKSSEKILNYGKHHIDEDDINAVVDVLRNGWLTQGPKVAEFEQIVADYVGAKYAVAVSSWTAGLHLSCLAAGIGKGDSVLTSPNSFVASSNCALYVGADPAFADIDPDTLNIDPDNIDRECERLGNVKAIIPVHFGGLPCDMEKIAAIAKEYNAVIIEDAAHAIGATYADGSRVGNCRYSLMTGFSFHPVKNIASGEGGMITTNDEGVYRSLLRLRSHGINKFDDELINKNEAFENGMKNPWYYEMQELGFNYRITDIQCALGVSQFKKLDRFLRRRIEIAKKYDFAFSEFRNLRTFQEGKREASGNHLYIVGIDFEAISLLKNEFMAQLKKLGINGHTHYIPIPIQPYYDLNFEIPKANYQNAMEYYKSAITLPLYPSMSDDDVNYVIETLRELVG